MSRQKSTLVTMGIPSLFLIFSVLCLIILSLLSYGTSRSDYLMSKEALDHTAAYYDACSQATEIYQRFLADYQKLSEKDGTPEEDQNAFRQAAEDLSTDNVCYNEAEDYGEFCLAISDTQELYVRFSLDPESRKPQIDIWKTQVSGEWTPDLKQHVYQK